MPNGVAVRRVKKSTRRVGFSNPGFGMSVRCVKSFTRRVKISTRRVENTSPGVEITSPGVEITSPGVEKPTRRLVGPHQGAEKKEEAFVTGLLPFAKAKITVFSRNGKCRIFDFNISASGVWFVGGGGRW